MAAMSPVLSPSEPETDDSIQLLVKDIRKIAVEIEHYFSCGRHSRRIDERRVDKLSRFTYTRNTIPIILITLNEYLKKKYLHCAYSLSSSLPSGQSVTLSHVNVTLMQTPLIHRNQVSLHQG